MMLLLFAPVVVIAACHAAWRLYRSSSSGATLLVAALVLNAITVEPIEIQLAGFHIYVDDLVGLALASIALLRLWTNSGAIRRVNVWFGFLTALLLAFVLGAVWNGVKAAGVEFRQFFYFVAAIVYTASFPLTSHTIKGLARVWLAGSVALVALALFRWAAVLLQLGIAGTWASVGAGQPMRVLNAAHALFLAQGMLILIYYSRRTGAAGSGLNPLRLLLCVLAGSVIVLQHRSVWVALLVSAGALCYREGMFRRFLAAATAVTILAGITILANPEGFAIENAVASSLVASAQEPFDLDRSSFGWRLLMWREYVLEFLNLSPARKLTGVGFGNPGAYFVGAVESAASAHNLYIFTLNRAGILGLATLAMCFVTLRRRVRIPRQIRDLAAWTPSSLLFAILAGQLAYFTVYGPSPDQGLLVGAMTAIPSLWCEFETGAANAAAEEDAVAAGVA